VREVWFDAATTQLVSLPVDELKALRGDTLGALTSPNTAIAAGGSLALFEVRSATGWRARVSFCLS
jgi:hypothetical protein